MEQKKRKNRKKWIERFRHKYRLVVMQEDTFEEKLSFRLSRFNVFVGIALLAIFLIASTIYLIAYTPLKQYIPGYSDVQLQEDLYEQVKKTDSLERVVNARDIYLYNLKNILHGNTEALRDTALVNLDTNSSGKYENIKITRSKQDSLLRLQMREMEQYNLIYFEESGNRGVYNKTSIRNFFFFTPLHGQVTNGFNPEEEHYGIDIVGKENDAVKATLDGRVIFANWTLQTGYVIVLMHKNNVISVYKHNASLLRQQGETVKAGEPIAIFGNSGELTTGPHLHFEIWYNGSPVNPREYMSF